MDIWVWIVVIVLLLLLVGAFIGRQAARGTDPTQLLLDPELVGRVRALAQSDKKIAAIKLLREGNPGLGLASAKVMVDRMAAPPASPTARGSVAHDPLTPAELSPSTSSLPLEVELQARSLKSEDRVILAIKLVREHTGWGLRKAKDFVDRL